MDSFYNKNVLIAAKSTGLVMELAKHFTREKANIILLSENRKDAAVIESEIDNMRGRISVYLLDLSSEKGVDKMVERIIRDNDRIDVIISGGYAGKQELFFESNLKAIKENLKTASLNGMLLTRYFLPYLISCGKGYIVNIGPDAVKSDDEVFYTVNNAALRAFSNGLEKYLKAAGHKEIGAMYVERSGKSSVNDQAVVKIIAAIKKNKIEIRI